MHTITEHLFKGKLRDF